MRKVFRSTAWNVLVISWGLLVLGLLFLALELLWPRIPGDTTVYGGSGYRGFAYWFTYPYNLFFPPVLTAPGVPPVLLIAFSRIVVDSLGISKYNFLNMRVAYLPWRDLHGCTYHDNSGQLITLLESSDSQIRFPLDTPWHEEITRAIIPHLPALLRPERLGQPTNIALGDAGEVTT